jgi:hypothetical protein
MNCAAIGSKGIALPLAQHRLSQLDFPNST